DGRIREADWTD
ncbi:hypothetical protein GWI33_016045, partial [Rhynchophorus ferrugineus]